MASSKLVSLIGEIRARSFITDIPMEMQPFAVDLYRFDLNLRGEVIKAMSMVEIALELCTEDFAKQELGTTFGTMRRRINELDAKTQFQIAKRFGFSTQRELKVAMRNFNTLRNRAAHHEPIWQRKLHFGIPQLRGQAASLCGLMASDLYSPAASFALLARTLRFLPPLVDFELEFDQTIGRVPVARDFILKSMGFEVP